MSLPECILSVIHMARFVDAFVEAPHPCSYLPSEQASLDVRIGLDVQADELGHMLARGWRRFGPTYFRPACTACSACIPTRIPVATFRPSTSQRRAVRQSMCLTYDVQTPQIDDERLNLYARWHQQREQTREWRASTMDAEQYAMDFAFPHPAVREVTFRAADAGNRLVGLGIIDVVPDALSAVYFFWDPEHATPSLGTAHVVRLVELAGTMRLSSVYLGYKVDDCRSLAYKGRFRPQERLVGWPADNETPLWQEDRTPDAD
jgi:arginyl-tRNA--protein-N-Asp/Glu arginylyltransferase